MEKESFLAKNKAHNDQFSRTIYITKCHDIWTQNFWNPGPHNVEINMDHR